MVGLSYKFLYVKNPINGYIINSYHIIHVIEGDFKSQDFIYLNYLCESYFRYKEFNDQFLIIEGTFDIEWQCFNDEPTVTKPSSNEIIKYLLPDFYEQINKYDLFTY